MANMTTLHQDIEELSGSRITATDVEQYEIDDAIDMVETCLFRLRARRRRAGALSSMRSWLGLHDAMEREGIAVPDYVIDAAEAAERRAGITEPRR